ncbi:MAG: peptidylprolyl isomerase [Prevotella sp.]|uniref:peptidylprolyl isomerase n=1 Tax=Prevotella sp. TaxID=59823 RepID=UPI0025FECBF1|nr:peptidylprolyl isomerase [Prevotella sp.]MCI7118209.1 peptidylprolyl isomerase [Prevotella sp.]
MKFKSLLAAMLIVASSAGAQTADPVVMTINGNPVLRSEFEYSYNKNNSETVVDKKSVADYVPLFVNYKLKVLAAEAAGIDTTSTFRKEFLSYRDQQVRPSFINDDDVEAEARKIYKETQTRIDSNGGLVRPSHILLMLKQNATQAEQDAAKLRADSIYTALVKGANFADLARRLSDDKGSASRGGDISWVQKGQTVKEFEDVVFTMKKGELSKPFLSPFGYHIVKLMDKQNFFPYDTLRADIRRFIDQRGLRDHIVSQKLDSLAKAAQPATTVQSLLDKRADEMAAKDPALRNLIREYHDGLLLYDISNRLVWDKAAKDEAGLAAFFKKNRKRYAWTEPRFKGIAYNCKNAADVEAVKRSIKKVDFDDWAETLRKQFNDSTLRIKVVKGIFKKGDNALVDREIFQVDTTYTAPKGYEHTAVFGKKLKAPKTYDDVRELVVADYQEYLEKQWIADLRKQYPVVLNEEALATVNKH